MVHAWWPALRHYCESHVRYYRREWASPKDVATLEAAGPPTSSPVVVVAAVLMIATAPNRSPAGAEA